MSKEGADQYSVTELASVLPGEKILWLSWFKSAKMQRYLLAGLSAQYRK